MQHVQSGRERLHDGQPERLLAGGRDEHVDRAQHRGHVGAGPRGVARSEEPDAVRRAEPPGQSSQRRELRPLPGEHQPHAGQRRDGPHEDVEPLARDQPPHAPDHEGVLGEAEEGTGGAPGLRVEPERPRVDAVRHQVDALLGHAPLPQPAGHGGGDRDRRGPQPLRAQVERAGTGGERAALDLRVPQGVFGGHTGADPGQSRGDPAVDAGPVEMGVHEVVRSPAHEPGEPPTARRSRFPAMPRWVTRTPSARSPSATAPGLVSVTTSQETGR